MSSTVPKMNNDNSIWQTEEGKYFAEIEHYFSRKRAFPTLLSTKEWFLVKSWYEDGIPLSLIERAIDKVAQRKDFNERRISLFYCKGEVMKEWKDYKKAMAGSSSSAVGEAKFEIKASQINEHIDVLIQALEDSMKNAPPEYQVLSSVFNKQINSIHTLKFANDDRTINAEEFDTIEHALTAMELAMIKKILKKLPDEIFKKILSEAKEAFSRYENIISKVAYDKTLENFVRKTLMKILAIPRFSIYNEILSREDNSVQDEQNK